MISAIQARMARAAIKAKVSEVAQAIDVRPNTVSDAENKGGNISTMTALQQFYGKHGVSFGADGTVQTVVVDTAKDGHQIDLEELTGTIGNE